jgi:hypothetical protein
VCHGHGRSEKYIPFCLFFRLVRLLNRLEVSGANGCLTVAILRDFHFPGERILRRRN